MYSVGLHFRLKNLVAEQSTDKMLSTGYCTVEKETAITIFFASQILIEHVIKRALMKVKVRGTWDFLSHRAKKLSQIDSRNWEIINE